MRFYYLSFPYYFPIIKKSYFSTIYTILVLIHISLYVSPAFFFLCRLHFLLLEEEYKLQLLLCKVQLYFTYIYIAKKSKRTDGKTSKFSYKKSNNTIILNRKTKLLTNMTLY